MGSLVCCSSVGMCAELIKEPNCIMQYSHTSGSKCSSLRSAADIPLYRCQHINTRVQLFDCNCWDSPHSSAAPASKPIHQALLSRPPTGHTRGGSGSSGNKTRISLEATPFAHKPGWKYILLQAASHASNSSDLPRSVMSRQWT